MNPLLGAPHNDELVDRAACDLFGRLGVGEGHSGGATAAELDAYSCDLLLDLLSVPDLQLDAAEGHVPASTPPPPEAAPAPVCTDAISEAISDAISDGTASNCGGGSTANALWTAMPSVSAAGKRGSSGGGGDQRSKRRREFHKIHTRRSRAKLNEKMELLRRVLPEPPAGVVVKSKAQIIDHAIAVLSQLQDAHSAHPRS
ncbi:hypothetical protein BWQ96_01235 [Gracilariopsis chorda]|uniref:BHLH domain-containing protein n=1 Tax=Gracilariopsis chorda TaxID=448386 RepID=A0A2V3J3I4_9FLOR|nr:hypothetical protein BWQ96_01235 [Gracilariopsis chorda]|eukprot:PXF48893.1 hypothetical protein BWQ96_01235 [Gracilariopsis chorda]